MRAAALSGTWKSFGGPRARADPTVYPPVLGRRASSLDHTCASPRRQDALARALDYTKIRGPDTAAQAANHKKQRRVAHQARPEAPRRISAGQ